MDDGSNDPMEDVNKQGDENENREEVEMLTEKQMRNSMKRMMKQI